MLDIMAVGLRRLEEVQRGRRPLERMADFTQWGYAVAPAIVWTEDDFRLAYRRTRREAQHTVIDSDPVAAGILALVHGTEQRGKPWRGSQASLWQQLAEKAGDAAKTPGFPESPEALGWALKRVIPVLGDRGIIRKPGAQPACGSRLSPELAVQECRADAGVRGEPTLARSSHPANYRRMGVGV